MTGPVISVAMSVYNSAPFLADAIESILAQSYGNFEFLIVNDGSTDGSGAIINDYAARDSRILPVHQDNQGFVWSLNRTIEMARGRWIARMDSDDISCPDRFARQMKFLRANERVGILGTSAHVIDSTGTVQNRAPIKRPVHHEDIVANFKEGVNLLHPSIIVDADLMRRVGGYRAPFRFAQDYDLYLRLSQVTKMANLDEHLLHYRVHSDQVSTRHLIGQTLSAVVAWLSYEARLDGRADPVDLLTSLPELGTLDALFGVEGADSYARRRIVERSLYAPDVLAGDAFDVLVGHVRDSGANTKLWRVVPRLLRAGYPSRAARLGAALALA